MLFTKKNKEIEKAPKTKKEKLDNFACKVEKIMDKHPYAFIAVTCGTVHVLGYTYLHYALKPPKNNPTTTEACEI